MATTPEFRAESNGKVLEFSKRNSKFVFAGYLNGIPLAEWISNWEMGCESTWAHDDYMQSIGDDGEYI